MGKNYHYVNIKKCELLENSGIWMRDKEKLGRIRFSESH
jgi:hypothetical protein